MNEHGPRDEQNYVRAVRRQVARTQQGRRPSFQRNIAAFGVIGWMIALPAVGGAFLGRWLDGRFALKPLSWTLCLLLLGLALGCTGAWQYVERELKR